MILLCDLMHPINISVRQVRRFSLLMFKQTPTQTGKHFRIDPLFWPPSVYRCIGTLATDRKAM